VRVISLVLAATFVTASFSVCQDSAAADRSAWRLGVVND
jgi:hypothetical protein